MKTTINFLRWLLFLPLGVVVGYVIPEVFSGWGVNLAGDWWWGKALVSLLTGYWRVVCPYRLAKWVATRAEGLSLDAMKTYCWLVLFAHILVCFGPSGADAAAGLNATSTQASSWWLTACMTFGALYGFSVVLLEDGPTKLCQSESLAGSDHTSSFDWCESIGKAKA